MPEDSFKYEQYNLSMNFKPQNLNLICITFCFQYFKDFKYYYKLENVGLLYEILYW